LDRLDFGFVDATKGFQRMSKNDLKAILGGGKDSSAKSE
jgi:hypothetical protein